MTVTVPDYSWYRAKSSKADVACSCPYANVRKCYRYYASIYLLGEIQIITSMSEENKSELKEFWNQSGIVPVIAEEDTGVSDSCYTNFCPEVSYEYFSYYASSLFRYVDEIDKEYGQRKARRENIENDWRYEWQTLKDCHYLECKAYNQVNEFNSRLIGKFDKLVHSNIVVLISRMENCLDSNDPSGVLHAASNILETMAKDVLGDERLAKQTLGGFIDKYKNESNLPDEIKNIVSIIYNLRNIMPLSGHGSTTAPNIKMQDAIVIAAVTKFIVEIEYRTKKI